MENKTTQRIIGVLIAVALVIILLPLLFNNNEPATETAAVQAPPLPDQATASIAMEEAKNPVPVAKPETTATAAANVQQVAEVKAVAPAAAPVVTPTPAQQQASAASEEDDSPVSTLIQAAEKARDSISDNLNPQTISQTLGAIAPATTTDVAQTKEKEMPPVKVEAVNEKVATTKEVSVKKVSVKEASKSAANKSNPVAHPVEKVKTKVKAEVKKVATPSASGHLAALKDDAWVVQMGSFNSKANAQRLANQLRSLGYKAFMHEVKAAKDKGTIRVYVGPEFKKGTVASLAGKIEHDVKIRGIVMNYKPLEL